VKLLLVVNLSLLFFPYFIIIGGPYSGVVVAPGGIAGKRGSLRCENLSLYLAIAGSLWVVRLCHFCALEDWAASSGGLLGDNHMMGVHLCSSSTKLVMRTPVLTYSIGLLFLPAPRELGLYVSYCT